MKNKIREKIVASIMLSAFVVTNSIGAAFAVGDYGYGNYSKPAIRAAEGMPSDINVQSNVEISNGDSIVNLSLRDADVKQVLRMFADQAGMNIIFSAGVTGEASVTMDLVDIPLRDALNLVIKTNNLFYDIQGNTLIVSNSSEPLSVAQKGMTLIPVRYVNANALASFLNTNFFNQNSNKPGVSTKPVVTVNPASNELIVMGTENDVLVARRIVEQFDKKPAITTFKVNHTTPAEMANLICESMLPATVSNGAGSASGGSTGYAASISGVPTGFASDEEDSSGGGDSSSSGGGSIAVGGGKLVCTVNAAAPSSDGMQGLALKSLSVSYFPTLGTVQVIGGSPTQIEMIRDYIASNDRKTPQAYLEVQIISLSETGSKTFDNNWQFLSKNFSFNAGGGAGGFSTATNYPVFFAGHGFKDKLPEGSLPNPLITSGKWSTSPQLVYAVNYLIENRKGRVLASPRVLLTSGQSSTIDLTSDYVSKVTSQYLDNSSGSGSAQVQKEYEIKEDNGIKVTITPFISPDGYVTLDIKPKYATIKEKVTTASEVEGEDDLAATLLQRRNLDLKGVRIKDGETLVIGGMIQETEQKNVTKIPFLGDIPVIGMFFRSTTTEKSKEEMVMMLTPQIVIDTEDAVGNDTTL